MLFFFFRAPQCPHLDTVIFRMFLTTIQISFLILLRISNNYFLFFGGLKTILIDGYYESLLFSISWLPLLWLISTNSLSLEGMNCTSYQPVSEWKRISSNQALNERVISCRIDSFSESLHHVNKIVNGRSRWQESSRLFSESLIIDWYVLNIFSKLRNIHKNPIKKRTWWRYLSF